MACMMTANAANKQKATAKPAQPTRPADAADAVILDMSQAFQKGDRKKLAALFHKPKGMYSSHGQPFGNYAFVWAMRLTMKLKVFFSAMQALTKKIGCVMTGCCYWGSDVNGRSLSVNTPSTVCMTTKRSNVMHAGLRFKKKT